MLALPPDTFVRRASGSLLFQHSQIRATLKEELAKIRQVKQNEPDRTNNRTSTDVQRSVKQTIAELKQAYSKGKSTGGAMLANQL